MDDFADCNSYSADHDVPQKRRHYWPHILQSSGRKAGGALPWLLLIVLGCRGLGVGILAPVRRRYAGAGDDLTWSLTARRSVHRCRFARSMDPDAPCGQKHAAQNKHGDSPEACERKGSKEAESSGSSCTPATVRSRCCSLLTNSAACSGSHTQAAGTRMVTVLHPFGELRARGSGCCTRSS